MAPMAFIVRAAIAAVVAVLATALPAAAETGGKAVYKEHCAECHGAERLGGTGPALLPGNLRRLRKKGAHAVIAKGRVQTQMEGFDAKLSKQQISALIAYIFTPPAKQPIWGRAEIEASRNIAAEVDKWIKKPFYKADPLNLFVVVESGDHHVSILDGDTFEVIHRFRSRFALHGGPKFTRDGRYVYFASRDGWITKFDLYTLEVLAEVRAGINTRNMAISEDDATLAVANYLPNTLVLLNAEDLSIDKIFDVRSRNGVASRVSAVYQARPRKSFIVALKDVPEIWEIATDPNAGPVYDGLVHSHEEGNVEGIPTSKGLFARRRIEVDRPLDDFFFDQPYRHLIGSWRGGKGAAVVNLNVGRVIGEVPLPGLPHLGSGITFDYKGTRVMATQHLREARISIIDMKNWQVIKTIKTKGPGFFMRSHDKTPYAWSGVFFGPNKDLMHVIDKRTLEIVKTLRPAPGKTAAHVEFTRNGSHALVSIWENDGALVVYDARTLKEVKRIPMNKPSGKYNVYNKITFSSGTSH